jgi:hypothetical protein
VAKKDPETKLACVYRRNLFQKRLRSLKIPHSRPRLLAQFVLPFVVHARKNTRLMAELS